MSTSAEQFERMREQLANECLYGQLHYRLWRDMMAELREDEALVDVAPFFFQQTVDAHADSATLHLLRLIDGSSSSVWSVNAFLSFCKKHASIFREGSEDDVIKAVKEQEDILGSDELRLTNFIKQRNKRFVHLASEFLSQPGRDVYAEYPATYAELYQALRAVGNVINRMSKLYDTISFRFELDEERASVKRLFHCLRRGHV